MLRKRRQPAPFFGMPGAPFNPTTGERAPLQNYPAKGTVLALFQVVEEDTHDNYIACRGYEAESDPEFRFLHDPHTVPTTTPINVAKPYSVRGTFPYELGQVVVAARIKGRLGYNQGKAATSTGQPADLDEEIELLTDDDDVAISWLDIDTSTDEQHFAYGSFGISGSFSGIGTTALDIGSGSAVVGGGFTATGGAGREFEWTGGAMKCISHVTATIIPQSSAPASDTTFLIGFRGDVGAGYSANMQSSPILWIYHTFRAGVVPPFAAFTCSAMWPFEIANGSKYKMSAQRISGDMSFNVILENCTFAVFGVE